MKARTIIWLAAAAVTTVGVVVVWRQLSLAPVAAAAQAALAGRAKAAGREIEEARAALAAAETERAAQIAILNQLATEKLAATEADKRRERERRPELPWIPERLQNEPGFQIAWLAAQRAQVAVNHGAFMERLKLPAETRDRFTQILVRYEEQEMDIQATARSQGLRLNDDSIKRLFGEAWMARDQALRELLGETEYAGLREYDRSSSVRSIVNNIAGGAVVVAREPLTAEQGEQLVHLLASASPSFLRGGHVNPNDIDWDFVDAHAATILSPAQFELYLTMEPPLPSGGRFSASCTSALRRPRNSTRPGRRIPGRSGFSRDRERNGNASRSTLASRLKPLLRQAVLRSSARRPPATVSHMSDTFVDRVRVYRFCPRCGAEAMSVRSPQLAVCGACGIHLYYNPCAATAAIIVDDDDHVLLVRRAKPPAEGKLAFPGGFVDNGESAEDGLRRELREEIGIEVGALEFLLSHPNTYPYGGVIYPTLDFFFVARVPSFANARALDGIAGLVRSSIADVKLDDLAFVSMRAAWQAFSNQR